MKTLEEHRRDFRARRRPALLTGWTHFAAILLLAAAATAVSARLVREPAWWEWAFLPLGFVIANFVEWLAHRFPMHHPTGGLRIMYEKHTLEHHAFFREDAMAAGPEDFDAVLFSLPSLALFLLVTGLPIALLFFALVSWNAGWLFSAMAIDYYALYECFHTAYHLPETHWCARLPWIARRRRHHALHHDTRLMTEWNFNVTFPIFDAAFGTLKG